MTNERAVEILNLNLDILGQYGGETAEAYKMAIKALEQQPKTSYISIDVKKLTKEVAEKALDEITHEGKTIREWAEILAKQQPCEDCISREEINEFINVQLTDNEEWASSATNEGRWVEEKKYLYGVEILEGLSEYVNDLPSVKPKYTDEEIDKAQAVEQAYVDKMVELAVEESRQKWLESFDTSSATKCFEAVNILKERLKDGRD